MSLWKRGIEKNKDVETSEKLCREREGLLKKFPGMMEAWEKANSSEVRKAAEELSIVERMENPDGILAAKKALREAIWKRDTPRYDLQLAIDELNGKIGALSSPVIFEKTTEWQKDLSSLRKKKIIERVSGRYDHGKEVHVVTYKSNFDVLNEAKAKLTAAISALRIMGGEPLSRINGFIEKTESELSKLDFSELVEAPEISEFGFHELTENPEITIYTTAKLLPGSRPGQDRIQKNYDLPRKEI